MGCDIHAFVEYQYPTKNWCSFADVDLGRHYGIFGLLSKGVRSEFYESYPAKGAPADLGHRALSEFTYFVTDRTEYQEGYISKEDAEASVAKGYTEWVGDRRIRRSDWHSASWVTTNQLETLLSLPFVVKEWKDLEDYKATLEMMKCFQSHGFECRLVFWFDN